MKSLNNLEALIYFMQKQIYHDKSSNIIIEERNDTLVDNFVFEDKFLLQLSILFIC